MNDFAFHLLLKLILQSDLCLKHHWRSLLQNGTLRMTYLQMTIAINQYLLQYMTFKLLAAIS